MLRLSVDRIFRIHCGVIAAVLVGHLIAGFAIFLLRKHTSLSSAFYMLEETSVPTVISVAALLATAAAAWTIAAYARANRTGLFRSWMFVAACVTFMAIDEGAALHDRLAVPLQRWFDLTGVFYIGWVLPFLVLVTVVGVLCVPLIRALPWRTSLRLVVAGAVFVVSAIGMEMAEATLMSRMAGDGTALGDVSSKTMWAILHSPLMFAFVTVEEIGEMVGVALALRALLLHLVVDLGVSALQIGAARAGHASARRIVVPGAAVLE